MGGLFCIVMGVEFYETMKAQEKWRAYGLMGLSDYLLLLLF